jgi:hypothetical protein
MAFPWWRSLLVPLLAVLPGGVHVPAASASAAVCNSCVGVIGDSLTYQGGAGADRIRNELVAAGWDAGQIRVDGLIGRPIANDFSGKPGSLTTVSTWKADGFDPAVYVIALGSNNKNATATTWTTDINKLLTAIGPGHSIVWHDLGFRDATDSRALGFNANLAGIAAGRTDLFVARADDATWNDWIHAQPNQSTLWLPTDVDGVHMTSAGYALRNRFLGRAMLPFAPQGEPPAPTEYVTNGSVETDLAGWGGVTSSASLVARSGEAAHHGAFSVKTGNRTTSTAATIGFGTTTNNGGQHWVTGTTPGTVYTASAWVKAGATGQVQKVFVKELRPDGTSPASPSVTVARTATDTAWHHVSATYTAKEAGNSLMFRVWTDNAPAGAFFHADSLSLTSPGP